MLKSITQILISIVLIFGLGVLKSEAYFEKPHNGRHSFKSYNRINMSNYEASGPLHIRISKDQSRAFSWKPGQRLVIKAYVLHASGHKQFIKDRVGKAEWLIQLNQNAEGNLFIYPRRDSFSGRLIVKVNGRSLYSVSEGVGRPLNKNLEKIKEYCFEDDVCLQVHYTDQLLEVAGASPYFPDEVLDAAVLAYQTIVDFKNFDGKGFSLSRPDKKYAYDPDNVIDIYIGMDEMGGVVPYPELKQGLFKESPYFDAIKVSETAFQAVIALPANYYSFIKQWDKTNVSSLGTRNPEIDLRGTLAHEMIHAILFYYNRNLNKASEAFGGLPGTALDWYVEGLARYFEIFVGARHDFYSQGFRQVLPTKIRFSRGGCNYFMRYPDQPFFKMKYETALFWRFLDNEYGMDAIERISRNLRAHKNHNYERAIERAIGRPFTEIIKKYARCVLLKEFGLKDDQRYLKDVATTKLLYKGNALYLVGHGQKLKRLGNSCDTDWIGEWDSLGGEFGSASLGGDATKRADVSSYATDYIELQFEAGLKKVPGLTLEHTGGGRTIGAQILVLGKGGSVFLKDNYRIGSHEKRRIHLNKIIRSYGLSPWDIEKVYILLTNYDPKKTTYYRIAL